jgi:hypothetical protein
MSSSCVVPGRRNRRLKNDVILADATLSLPLALTAMVCYIAQLSPEVLEVIFKHANDTYGEKENLTRLLRVCKAWKVRRLSQRARQVCSPWLRM